MLKSPLLYTLLIGILFCVPGFKIVQMSIEKEHSKNTQELAAWTQSIEEVLVDPPDFVAFPPAKNTIPKLRASGDNLT